MPDSEEFQTSADYLRWYFTRDGGTAPKPSELRAFKRIDPDGYKALATEAARAYHAEVEFRREWNVLVAAERAPALRLGAP